MQPLEADDPSTIGPYRLVARLGAGGMGRVYLARSAGGRTVAVKVVRPELADDPDFRARFRREVAAAQSVDAAYTARVVDADRDSATPWLATSYVLGPSLNEAVATYGPLPEHSVRALGAVLAEALGAIHGAGLIHRDLKPSNVLLAADGPRVIDFGIARAFDGGDLTSTGVVVGSPGFMSPEQASGRAVGPEGDVFSLGSVLAFAATGHGPFGQDSVASLLYRVVHDAPDLEPVPAGLREAIGACLAKAPEDRPTPAQLLGMLAPDGAQAVLRGSWLPADVASGIAQHAARVMELETPTPHNPVGADPRGAAVGQQQPEHGTFVLGGQPGANTPPASSAPALGAAQPSRRKLLYGALGVAAIAVAGGGTALALAGGGKPKPTPTPTLAASPSVTPTTFPTRPSGVPPQPLWTYTADGTVGSAPVATDGRVLFAGSSATALDARRGTPAWTGPQVNDGILMPPIGLGGGFAVMLTNDRKLVGLNPANGAQLWSSSGTNDLQFEYLLGVSDQAAFILGNKYPLDAKGMPVITMGANYSAVMAVDLHTRKVLWTEPRNASASNQVLGFATDKYLVYTNDLNNVVVRSATNGTQLWSQDFGEPKWSTQAMPLLVGDTIYLPGPEIIGYGLDHGDRRFTSKPAPKGTYLGLTHADGFLYASNLGTAQVMAVDLKSGAIAWEAAVPPDLMGTPLVVVGGTVFCVSLVSGSSEGIAAIDRSNGKVLWTFQDGVDSTDDWALSTDGTLLYGAHHSRVYALPPI
ncbi:outer membrane protein assembly factor BamB [Streptacidiphilus sp. MAP12-20]|uniref:protein kinase domain-containing protein n=1 Tax=Streptacidiphilus sp. MAP12-20 TaxID=3156299 RepID=UPI003512829A